MADSTFEIPLFPLDLVFFPGTVLPLHIFEPRYRQMIEECQQEEKPFGMVLARPDSKPLLEEPYPVGTLAEIRDLHRLEDGRYVLMAVGLQRFHIVSQHREKPYLCGVVESYEDIPEPAQDLAASAKQASDLFNNYLEMLLAATDEKDIPADLPENPETLSHFIAYFLDIQDEQKQQFLELTSTRQRLQEEIGILRYEVPFMRQILLMRSLKSDRSRLN